MNPDVLRGHNDVRVLVYALGFDLLCMNGHNQPEGACRGAWLSNSVCYSWDADANIRSARVSRGLADAILASPAREDLLRVLVLASRKGATADDVDALVATLDSIEAVQRELLSLVRPSSPLAVAS